MPHKGKGKQISDIEAASDTIINSSSFFNSTSRNINSKRGVNFGMQSLESETFENSIEKRC